MATSGGAAQSDTDVKTDKKLRRKVIAYWSPLAAPTVRPSEEVVTWVPSLTSRITVVEPGVVNVRVREEALVQPAIVTS